MTPIFSQFSSGGGGRAAGFGMGPMGAGAAQFLLYDSAEFDAFVEGSNKVTKTGKIMQFKSIQIQPGNVRQTKLYEYNSELSRLEYVKGIECKNCEGGVKIAFDRLNEKSDLYHYWCIGGP